MRKYKRKKIERECLDTWKNLLVSLNLNNFKVNRNVEVLKGGFHINVVIRTIKSKNSRVGRGY
jgi:hypothetical protein